MPNRRQDGKAEEMRSLYAEGFTLAQIGQVFGVSRQSVFKMLNITRSIGLRPKKKLPFIYFEGDKYTIRQNGYYAKTYGDREYLHRAIWKKHRGDIPDGYEIHHHDEDKLNNDIANLRCITSEEHYEIHGPILYRGLRL